jgi:hypothetical protein
MLAAMRHASSRMRSLAATREHRWEAILSFSDKVQAFNARLLKAAEQLISACKLTATARGMLDPKVLAYLLLCRTIVNFEGMLLLAKHRLVVEARTLARCCVENVFLAGGLNEQGDVFADKMKADDDAGRQQRLKFAQSTSNIFDSLEPEMQSAVASFLDRATKSNLLSPKSASAASAFKTAYLAYSQFSGDAAHPSLTALARHWRRAEDRTVEVVVRPDVNQAELDQTLLFAGMAVLGLLGVIDQMFGHVAPSGTLVRLRDELQALQDQEGANRCGVPVDATTE